MYSMNYHRETMKSNLLTYDETKKIARDTQAISA